MRILNLRYAKHLSYQVEVAYSIPAQAASSFSSVGSGRPPKTRDKSRNIALQPSCEACLLQVALIITDHWPFSFEVSLSTQSNQESEVLCHNISTLGLLRAVQVLLQLLLSRCRTQSIHSGAQDR
jgi:hypothetical protein